MQVVTRGPQTVDHQLIVADVARLIELSRNRGWTILAPKCVQKHLVGCQGHALALITRGKFVEANHIAGDAMQFVAEELADGC